MDNVPISYGLSTPLMTFNGLDGIASLITFLNNTMVSLQFLEGVSVSQHGCALSPIVGSPNKSCRKCMVPLLSKTHIHTGTWPIMLLSAGVHARQLMKTREHCVRAPLRTQDMRHSHAKAFSFTCNKQNVNVIIEHKFYYVSLEIILKIRLQLELIILIILTYLFALGCLSCLNSVEKSVAVKLLDIYLF